MAAIAYYLFVLPLSWLPLGVIYLFTDFLYLLLASVLPYRKSVIDGNISRSFPDKPEKEVKRLRRKFYRHFTDILAEGIKNISISEKSLKKRFKVSNPEVLNDLYKKDRSVLLVSGHFNNWEWLITSQNLLFNHQAVGIGMPLSSAFWDKKINERRARFGMDIIHSKIVREYFSNRNNDPIATLVLSDQSPGNSNKSYWMNFLNQPTAVLFGAEMLAHQYQQAVVFFRTEKVKRGHYLMHLELIAEDPKEMEWGEITEAHTNKLEAAIQANPQYWLWSHKRWKREVPTDIPSLRAEQKASFEKKFKS